MQLRPASAVTAMRSDTSLAVYENASGQHGGTAVSMLLASYKVTPELSPLIRLGVVSDDAPPTLALCARRGRSRCDRSAAR